MSDTGAYFKRAATAEAEDVEESLSLLSDSAEGSPAETGSFSGKGAGGDSREKDLFELLDDALEATCPGWFNYRLLGLTAFGLFVDATETRMMNLVAVELEKEWKMSEDALALMRSMTSLGMMIGSVWFGWMSDVYGRRLAYFCSLLVTALFGLFSSFANSIAAFTALRFMVGLGYGGNVVASATLLVEYTPTQYRAPYSVATGAAFGIGTICMVLLSWLLIPHGGWRWLIRIASIAALPVLVGLRYMPESIRWLVKAHKFEQAVDSLSYCARLNHKPMPAYFNVSTLQDIADKSSSDLEAVNLGRKEPAFTEPAEIESELPGESANNQQFSEVTEDLHGGESGPAMVDSEIVDLDEQFRNPSLRRSGDSVLRERKEPAKIEPAEATHGSVEPEEPARSKRSKACSSWLPLALCRKPLRRRFLALCVIWFLSSFASTVIGWLPIELANHRKKDAGVQYSFSLVLAISGLFASLGLSWVSQRVARRPLLRISLLISGAACMALSMASIRKSPIALLYLLTIALHFAQMAMLSILYVYTPEVFPTHIRVQAFAICSALHRAAPVISNLSFAQLDKVSFTLVCVVYGALYFVVFLVTFALNIKTFNRRIVD